MRNPGSGWSDAGWSRSCLLSDCAPRSGRAGVVRADQQTRIRQIFVGAPRGWWAPACSEDSPGKIEGGTVARAQKTTGPVGAEGRVAALEGARRRAAQVGADAHRHEEAGSERWALRAYSGCWASLIPDRPDWARPWPAPPASRACGAGSHPACRATRRPSSRPGASLSISTSTGAPAALARSDGVRLATGHSRPTASARRHRRWRSAGIGGGLHGAPTLQPAGDRGFAGHGVLSVGGSRDKREPLCDVRLDISTSVPAHPRIKPPNKSTPLKNQPALQRVRDLPPDH